jgi:hypothetical protein
MTLFRKVAITIIVVLIIFDIYILVVVPYFDLQLPRVPFLNFSQQLSDDVGNHVVHSYHTGSYENAWIQYTDKKQRLVQIKTVYSKIIIVFEVAENDNFNFRPGYITGVTFKCSSDEAEECDFESPYQMYVGNMPVNGKRWVFSSGSTNNEITSISIVNDFGDSNNDLELDTVSTITGMDGKELVINGMIRLKIDKSKTNLLAMLESGDKIPGDLFSLHEFDPYKATLMGVDADIILLDILENNSPSSGAKLETY